MTTEQQIARLDRHCRRLHGLLALVAILALAPWIAGAQRGVQEVVRAKNFLLFDDNGEQRGGLATIGGDTKLYLLSPDKKKQCVLTADDEMVTVGIEVDDNASWTAAATEKASLLTLVSPDRKLECGLLVKDGMASFEAKLDGAIQWLAGASGAGGRCGIRPEPGKPLERIEPRQ